MLNRRAFLYGTIATFLAEPLAADAQQAGRIPQVGVLVFGSEQDISQGAKAFRDGLRELGWVENQTVHLQLRFAHRSHSRLRAHAAELVQSKVDVIAAHGTDASRAAQQATKTVPIVMAGVGDPIRSGLVSNLAKPGGNITGVSMLLADLGGKRLELLKELLHGLSRVTVVHVDQSQAVLQEMRAAAPRLSIDVQSVVFESPDILASRLTEIRARTEALVVLPNPLIDEFRSQIAELAIKHNTPTMFAFREYVEAGGLMSYGASLSGAHRRAATHVDKILKGANAGDLPVEQMATFELVINLKTARALGLTIPPSLLLRADQVIE